MTGARLSAFLGHLTSELETGDQLEIAFSYALDWVLLEGAARDCDASRWESTKQHLRPANVFDMTGIGTGALAAEAYFKG